MILAIKPRRKMGNRPVWECQVCSTVCNTRPPKRAKGKTGGQRMCASCGSAALLYFASSKEFNRWQVLKLQEKAGEIRNLRRQVRYNFDIDQGHGLVRVGWAVWDFVYEEQAMPPLGQNIGCTNKWLEVVEDSKGHRTAMFIKNKKLMKACYGIEVLET